MSKCPFCNADISLDDFFHITVKQNRKGKIRKEIGLFKGEIIRELRHHIKMWACPSCDKVIGFSEYDSRS